LHLERAAAGSCQVDNFSKLRLSWGMPVQRDHVRRGDEFGFEVPDRIPVFPLPNVVFFPRTYLPLHIFEPRYREMVADAEARGQCIGMALLKDGWEEGYYRCPPVFQVGSVGRLVSVQRLADGRSNILLYGLARYEIVGEFQDKIYREAAITLFRPAQAASLDASLRSSVVESCTRYLRHHAERPPWRHLLDTGLLDDETLINGLSSSLDFTCLEKQFLLEAEDLPHHACRLRDLIQLRVSGPEAEG
jgi:Lon protease-like protein